MQAAGTVVEGNTYQRVPGGISVVYDDPWLEGSTDIRDVLIADNLFVDVGNQGKPDTQFSEVLQKDPGVANLTARNNTVKQS